MNKRKILVRIISILALVAFILGTVLAVFSMYAAFQHNSQGEFHDYNGVINWGDWLMIGISWAFIPYIFSIILLIVRLLVKRK